MLSLYSNMLVILQNFDQCPPDSLPKNCWPQAAATVKPLSALPILQRDTCILERGSHGSRGLLEGSCLLHSIECLYDVTFLPFVEVIYPNTTL
jgi:hypothetical protein